MISCTMHDDGLPILGLQEAKGPVNDSIPSMHLDDKRDGKR